MSHHFLLIKGFRPLEVADYMLNRMSPGFIHPLTAQMLVWVNGMLGLSLQSAESLTLAANKLGVISLRPVEADFEIAGGISADGIEQYVFAFVPHDENQQLIWLYQLLDGIITAPQPVGGTAPFERLRPTTIETSDSDWLGALLRAARALCEAPTGRWLLLLPPWLELQADPSCCIEYCEPLATTLGERACIVHELPG